MPKMNHLQSAEPPYVELLVIKEGQPYDAHMATPDGFVAQEIRGRKCKTKTSLLSEFAQTLHFPSYFGKNWDAFEECLTDLDWFPATGYLLVITDAEQVLNDDDQEDYKTFINILQEVGSAWGTMRAGKPGVPFHVVLAVTAQHKAKRKIWGIPLMKTP